MSFKKIIVAGGGVLGSQIAFQTAFKGFQVTVYDNNASVLQDIVNRFDALEKVYITEHQAEQTATSEARQRIALTNDLQEAFQDADLLIEAVSEDFEIKSAFYREASAIAPEKTIFATNTSTLPISGLVASVDRPKQFIALHFSNNVVKQNIAEVMGHAETAPKVVDELVAFSKQIGMIPLLLQKEHAGYISNSLILPILISALKLWADGVTDFQSIDKTFKIAFETDQLPFALIDRAGLNTMLLILNAITQQTNDPLLAKVVEKLEKEFVNEGKTGFDSGEGFYKYPNPDFLSKDFLIK